jgi:hypothetical protein
MPGYTIDDLPLSEYFDLHRNDIVTGEGWGARDNEIIARANNIAPNVPEKAIRKAYLRQKRTWTKVDEELFAKSFTVEK